MYALVGGIVDTSRLKSDRHPHVTVGRGSMRTTSYSSRAMCIWCVPVRGCGAGGIGAHQ